MQNDQLILHSHRKGLDRWILFVGADLLFDQFSPPLHCHFIGLDPQFVRVKDRAPCRQIKLPAVPGAANDLPIAIPAILTRLAGQRRTGDMPPTKGRQLVGTGVTQGVVLTLNVKDADGATIDLNSL